MAYLSLVALFFSGTNFVPLSAIGFLPIALGAWRFFGRTYPPFVTVLAGFTCYALISTLLYDPSSLLNFDFYRRDGNFFVAYAPVFAGCVYAHRWDMNRLLRRFYAFAVLCNLPAYALYMSKYGLLAMLAHPNDTFGSYFIARNAAGGFLAMLLCLGIACFMTRRSWTLLLLMLCNMGMLFTTYSRGSMLGVAVVVPYLLIRRRRWAGSAFGLLLAVLVGASVLIAAFHFRSDIDYMGYRFAIENANEKVANLDIRMEWLWPRALEYFRQSPFVGLGFGSFDDHIASVVDYFGVYGQPVGVTVVHSDSHAHNSFLNILAELGIIGLYLMLYFYWKLVAWAREGALAARYDALTDYTGFLFVELGAICLLVMSATEHRLTSPSNALPLTLAISLLLASRLRTATVTTGIRPRYVRVRPPYEAGVLTRTR